MAILRSHLLCVSWYVIMLHLCKQANADNIGTEESMIPRHICTTQECVHEARAIYEYRNVSAKPCNDFYEFVCGGWAAMHPVTKDREYRNTHWDLTELNVERIRDILEAESYSAEPEFVGKLKTFYKSCLKRDEQRRRNLQILIERLESWGGWPVATENWTTNKFDWLKLLLHLTRTNDIHPMFKVYVGANYRNASRPSLTIDQADDTYCSDHKDRSREKKLKESLVKIAVRIANSTNQNVSEKDIERDAERILRFEVQICKIRQKNKNRLLDSARFFGRTVRQIQDLTDAVEPVNAFAKINWLELLNDFLQGSAVNIDEKEEIVMIDLDYLPKLVELVDNTAQRTLANYMLWHHIKWMEAGKWLEIPEKDSESEENISKTESEEERWKTCAEETNKHFPHATGYLYVQTYLSDDVQHGVEELVKNINKSFVEDLQHIDWMDKKTRSAAFEKARKMKYLVGYPDWYNATSVNNLYQKVPLEDNFIINLENLQKIHHQEHIGIFDGTKKEFDLWSAVTVADAYNTYQISLIELYAGNFQSPIYSKGRPEALNYGGLGSLISHEITHSFDDLGRKYNGDKILKNWWTDFSLKKFKEKTQCIEEIYSEYPTPELEKEEAWRLDGPGTVTENIADVGGLEIAWSAYKKYLRKHGPEKKLPGLTQYTSEQLFFIGYALRFCETSTTEAVAQLILTDEHTPLRYRVLLTVANSQAFSEVWQCKENDKMNAPKRCKFW